MSNQADSVVVKLKARPSRTDMEVAGELYEMHETTPAVLRAELDATRERVDELRTSLYKKHGSMAEALREIEKRLGEVDAELAREIRDLEKHIHQHDIALAKLERDVESHGSQLRKLWKARDEQKEGLWKLRLSQAGWGGGSGAVVVGLLKALGVF